MQLDEETVRRVAFLARLKLDEEEVEKYRGELESILESFHVLNEAKVDGLEPAFQPIPVKNVFRRDDVGESVPQDLALSNTKNREGGFFKGPKVMD